MRKNPQSLRIHPAKRGKPPFNKGTQNNKPQKSQGKVKNKKIYFKSSKTHQKRYRFMSILTNFVTKRGVIRNLNCKGRSLLKDMRTCLQMPISSFLVGEDGGSSTCGESRESWMILTKVSQHFIS